MPSVGPTGHRFALSLAVGVAVSLGAILVLIPLVDTSTAWAALTGMNLTAVTAAVGSFMVSMIARAARWRAILPAGSAPPPRLKDLMPFVVIGYAANAVLPFRAGDVARGVLAAQRFSIGVPETLGSVALERLLDGTALALLLLAISLGVVVPEWLWQASILVVVGASAVTLAVKMAGRLGLPRLWQENVIGRRFWYGVQADNAGIRRSLGWSLMAWLMDGVTFWLCASALDLQVSYHFALLIAGGAALGSVAPSAPAALGTFELAGTAVAVALGMDPTSAFALVVLAHGITVVPLVLAAAAYSVSYGVNHRTLYRMRPSAAGSTTPLDSTAGAP